MRINLTTPFAEKDQVKALGVGWDAARKVWYIEDVEDLTPFTRWIPELADWDEGKTARKAGKRASRQPSAPAPETKPVEALSSKVTIVAAQAVHNGGAPVGVTSEFGLQSTLRSEF